MTAVGAVGLCRNEPNQLMAMCVACGRIVCGDISFTDVLKPDETGYAPVNLVILTVGNGPGEWWWVVGIPSTAACGLADTAGRRAGSCGRQRAATRDRDGGPTAAYF